MISKYTSLLPSNLRKVAIFIGWKNIFQYFFIQRILRINSHIPWPVHWSSSVSNPENIVRKHWRLYPGFMPGQYIQAINGIIFGKNVHLDPGVKIISANHNLNNFEEHIPSKPIEIGDNCWLSANVTILPDVRLGNHVIVEAGSVVTKNFPDNCIIGGIPAKMIKKIDYYIGNSDW